MLRISDIKLGTDDTESDLRKKVLKLLRNFAVPSRASLMILVSWSSG